MDKNTIIGFLLIGVVLVVFTWLNRPTPEQIEAQRRMQDSIARVEYAKQLDEQKKLNQEIEAEAELANLPDSVRMARLQNSFGVFAQAMTGEDGFTVLENDLLEEYGTTQMLSVATKSYGGTTEIFIRPDGSSGGVIVDGNEDGGSSPSEPGSGDEDSFG